MNVSHLLIHTIGVASPSGINDAGELSYGTAVSVKARVERKQAITKNAAGQFIATDHQILTETAIGNQDRIWMPGDSTSDATLARTPQAVDQADTINGSTTLYKVML